MASDFQKLMGYDTHSLKVLWKSLTCDGNIQRWSDKHKLSVLEWLSNRSSIYRTGISRYCGTKNYVTLSNTSVHLVILTSIYKSKTFDSYVH